MNSPHSTAEANEIKNTLDSGLTEVVRESAILKHPDSPVDDFDEQMRRVEIRSQKAIGASELSYRRLFEAAKDGILILEADTGFITDANPFLVDMLGYSHGELIGIPIWDLGPFKDIFSNKAKFVQLLEHGYVRYDNLPLETHDGRKIPVEFVSNIYLAGDRKVIQCNIRDISERRQAEEKIRLLNAEIEQRSDERQELEKQFIEAQKMEVVGQLASGIAHDFNNILAVILGYCDLVAWEAGSESPASKYTQEIQNACERGAGLTRQLLLFSGKQTVNPVVLDLNAVVAGMENMLHRLIDENIDLVINPGAPLGRVKADSGHVGQLIMNLVVNARDAMPKGGSLTIATHNVALDENQIAVPPGGAAGDYVVLSISDTGTGMTEEVKKRLFEPFFTTKPAGKGTGLGLATCNAIVRQSGAHITVTSELGMGTCFQMFFPSVHEPLEAPGKYRQSGTLPRGTETILLVEDDPSLREMGATLLNGLGYQVMTAANGIEALSLSPDRLGHPPETL